jgi:16S rRNA (adenine1518-N6/adenine1519-N6)-dimethyltransferase
MPIAKTIKARKRFSQNFLHDKNIINKIINLIDPKIKDHILEIGPGRGALTYALLDKVEFIEVIEIDKDLAKLMIDDQRSDKILLHQKDALKYNFSSSYNNKKIRLVGNLPYHISTPLIFNIIKHNQYFSDMHLMLQKEVAERVVSQPNSKIYGRLSIAIQARCNVKKIFDIKPNAFYPAPKVMSSIIKLTPKAPLEDQINIELNQILIAAFNQRRKKILNSLKELLTIDQIKKVNIDPESRPENLTVDDFLNLSKARKQ